MGGTEPASQSPASCRRPHPRTDQASVTVEVSGTAGEDNWPLFAVGVAAVAAGHQLSVECCTLGGRRPCSSD